MKYVGSRLLGRLLRSTGQVVVVGRFLRWRPTVKALAATSMLAPPNRPRYAHHSCPVCGSAAYQELIQMPFGYPEGQNHSPLYFDYDHIEMAELRRWQTVLDSTLGFVVSVPWKICPRCQNASLAIRLSQEQLTRYYTEYYDRCQPVHPNRRRTKELHAAFLARFLAPRSRVLDFGAAEGMAAAFLARQGYEVIACEVSAAYETVLRQGPFTWVSTIDQCAPSSFDAIYLHHVLEHLADPASCVRRFVALLKPGGLLMVQVPDLSLQLVHYQRVTARSVYAWLNPPTVAFNGQWGSLCRREGFHGWLDALDNNHVVAFTPEGLHYLLTAAGLMIEHTIQSTRDRLVWDLRRYAWMVDEETGNTPNGVTILARKPSL